MFYTILRSIPNKTGGIVVMGGSIAVLFLLPFINTSYVKNTTYRPLFKFFFWFFVSNVMMLSWIGQKPVKDFFVSAGKTLTLTYFFLVPVTGIIETLCATHQISYTTNNKNKFVNKCKKSLTVKNTFIFLGFAFFALLMFYLYTKFSSYAEIIYVVMWRAFFFLFFYCYENFS